MNDKTADSLALEPGEVHLWQADLDKCAPAQASFLHTLSAAEKRRARKFRFERDRRRFITGRGILRRLLGRYLATDPAEISFAYNAYGKPEPAAPASLKFNLSHSKHLALFALTAKSDIGVDIEYLNPDIELRDIAARFFAENEVKSLLALPEEERVLGFYNCWTRKEAFIKAVGEGLSFPLDKFEMSLKPDDPAELLATHWHPADVSNWSVYSLSPAPDFVGSIVMKGRIRTVEHFKSPDLKWAFGG